MVTRIGIAIVEYADQFLVGVRNEDIVLAGYDEFPGGKCNVDELPQNCAVRECQEETGIDVVPVRELLNVQHTYDHGDVDLHFWLCRPGNPGACSQPLNGFMWVAREALADCRFPEANRPLIEELVGD